MAEFNRRKFLIAGADVGAAGLLSGVVATTLPDMLAAARDRPLPEGRGILVIVTLYGGNDGINTVIPYTDDVYHELLSHTLDSDPTPSVGPDRRELGFQ